MAKWTIDAGVSSGNLWTTHFPSFVVYNSTVDHIASVASRRSAFMVANVFI